MAEGATQEGGEVTRIPAEDGARPAALVAEGIEIAWRGEQGGACELEPIAGGDCPDVGIGGSGWLVPVGPGELFEGGAVDPARHVRREVRLELGDEIVELGEVESVTLAEAECGIEEACDVGWIVALEGTVDGAEACLTN